jgi:lysophospholipase L1-like esterase
VFPDKAVCNLGLRGDTIQGMIDRVGQVRMLEPKQVFLMAGINDVSNVTAEEFEVLYNRLIEAIIQGLPKALLVVQSILPVNSKAFCSLNCNNEQINLANQIIQELAIHNCIKYLDLYELFIQKGFLIEEMTVDGIHLKANSYKIWYDSVVSLTKC